MVGEANSEWGQAVVAYVAFRDNTTESELGELFERELKDKNGQPPSVLCAVKKAPTARSRRPS